METIINYFEQITPGQRSIILLGGLIFFFLLEFLLPLFQHHYNRWKHAGINLFFTITTIIVNFVFAFLLAGTSYYVGNQEIGLLYLFELPIFVFTVIGLMLLDLLGAYFPHWLEHHVKWMWQLHLVHHSDKEVDTTTGNRHHPGESLIRFFFTLFAIIIVGAPLWLVFIYQSVSVILTQFNHSNVKMNSLLDKVLRLAVCTPNMHRVHHHYRQPYSDRNYGNIFSFWDRIFGTYVEVDNDKLKYGLDTYPSKEETENIITMLKIPFLGYREPIEYENEERIE